jgi:hypothetical protein
MRSLTRLTLAACAACLLRAGPGPAPYYAVLSEDAGAWPAILSSIGLQQKPASLARIFVARAGASASTEWPARVEAGAILILEGESSLAEMFGFRRTEEQFRATSVEDVHQPGLRIVWEKGLELPVFRIPDGARVFARERWNRTPMMAGLKRGAGAVLWVMVPPGERGYERFPYIPQALGALGLEAPLKSAKLWAFFDSSYRSRVDLDYFARRWRQSGIAALHVAAWHYFEPDAARDAYLQTLLEACHRAGLLVYAWLELPHVSERFWNEHPEWREKTAVLQDAHLDWRKLMNLANRDCFRAVSSGVKDLVVRFDWDGVNLAELYYESLEGIANPARFTPMNGDVRAMFRAAEGFDPLELFGARKDRASQAAFLEFRAGLARNMQEEWLGEMDKIRAARPQLDLVLTHVDDRFDTGMKDAIGADAARVLPLLDRHAFTFMVEDPATVWHLGAQRYGEIAARYARLTPRRDRLAIDLNIVERYQNVYPTKQQTGTELFQLVHQAAASFARVALYFENSLTPADLAWLPSAAAVVTRLESLGTKVAVESRGVAIPWRGPALVDGEPWPVMDDGFVWLPAGSHVVEPATTSPPLRLKHFTGELLGARTLRGGIEFSYRSSSRALAVLDQAPGAVEIDGASEKVATPAPATLFLPRGQHVVQIHSPQQHP